MLLFSARALAPMLMPSESDSPAWRTWWVGGGGDDRGDGGDDGVGFQT